MAIVAPTESVITPAHSTPDLWTALFVEFPICALILSFDLNRSILDWGSCNRGFGQMRRIVTDNLCRSVASAKIRGCYCSDIACSDLVGHVGIQHKGTKGQRMEPANPPPSFDPPSLCAGNFCDPKNSIAATPASRAASELRSAGRSVGWSVWSYPSRDQKIRSTRRRYWRNSHG